jgi:hypothetical protein
LKNEGDPMPFCEGFVLGKQHQELFLKESASKAFDVLELIHLNIWGPVNTTLIGGEKYFVTFINDLFWKELCYFRKHKGKCFEKFIEFKAFIESQFGTKIKTLKSDNKGDYLSTEF